MQRQHTYNLPMGRLLAFIFMLGLLGFANARLCAQAPTTAQATFKILEALTDQGNDGLKGLAIRFGLKMEGENAGPSPINYYLDCQVLDEFGATIPAATGAIAYRNAQGECRDSMAVNPYSPEHAADGLAMFVPYFAIGLPTGPCRVKLRLRLLEQRSHRLIAQSERVDISFQKPRMQLYRMTVERIESFTTDIDGETWDYKFLNARDIYPDIIWSLRRGHQDIFESPKQKNDTIYKGTAKDKSPWFWLSEGDRIHFSVKDFDLLGFSDLIGNLGIDIWRPDFASGRRNQLHFERVREAQVIQEALTPPGIAIRSYEVLENEVYEGVTGLRLKMDYEVSSVGNGARAFLAIRLPQDGGSAIPQNIRIIGPGAIPASDGMVELTAARSHLELFLAHYAFPQGIPARGNLLLDAMTLLDGQFFRLSQHKKQLSGRPTVVQDMQFGQWKIGVEDRVGRGGILVDLAYSVPQAYFAEEGKTKVLLEPSITAAWGMIDKGAIEAIGQSAAAWDGQFLSIDATNATGNLQLFIPFGECPPSPAKSVDFQVSYRAQYSLNERLIDIGHVQHVAAVDLPRLRKLEIGLREASVVQRAWLLSPPTMFWELYCGNLLLHRSKIDPEKRNAHWENNEMGDWVFAGSDRIELRIYHKGTNGDPDKLLEIWSGQLNALPDREKGNFRLQTTSLKKLVLHLDYQDNGRQGGTEH